MSILYAPSIIKPSRTLITPDTCVNYKHPLADKIVIYNPCLPPNAWIDCAKPYNNFLVPYSNKYWPFQKYAYGADGVVSNGYYGVVQYQIGDIISSETTAFFNQESYSILWTFSVGATTSLTRVGLGYNVSSSTFIGIGFDTGSYLLAGASDGSTSIYVTSSLIPKLLQTYTAVATFKKDGYLRLYIDGKEVGTAATASFKLSTSCRNIMMGNLNAGYSNMSPCRHKLAIYWNGRELSAEEVRDITADPYQVLEPPKTLFYFTGGGGSTTSVYSDTTLLFDVSETITSDSTIKYDINNIIYNDSSYKYDILNVISSDSTVKWDIFQNITSDLTSLWDMSGTVSSDSTLKWDMAGLVYSDIALKYDIYNQLASDLGVKFDILANIFGDIALKFDVNNVTTSDLTALWDMAGKIESDCTFIYDIETNTQVGFFIKQTRRDKASKYNRRKSNSMRYYVR